jgi:5S rRNA maturation endonuclease (ribonuclease M5)
MGPIITAALIADHLRGKPLFSGGWTARCPAHDDRHASLSINESDDGRILVHCHAGCSQDDLIASLKALGLWPARVERQPEDRRVVAAYDYTDENGEMLYQILRYEPKDFSQRYPDGSGGWIWQKAKRQVLYRLPEVLEAPIVFVVEGERDTETLRNHGFVATTNAGGAKTRWLPEYTETLRGREVILIPDNDPPGWRRVLAISRALIGSAAKIVVHEVNGAKDLSAWFDQGHSELQLISELEVITNGR